MESVSNNHIMTPADKHYDAIKRAVRKYQDANREVCRERCRNWAKNLKNDPEKYRKYLDEKNDYMKKYRRLKKQEQSSSSSSEEDI
jgi:hypothetical protein